ncbi:hypothetical protein CCHR01_14484 [Colletotrichum chrysophilum]|uniref:Uncharacterized protein n=1 Tax=Colletotrichum chrysophilum TaxID=1836956 RepID=A0AAD9EBV9_9PEZI|nr:hypothetical protein CCHR01_14484 [Colletotrichum chrysophilum]
MMRCDAMLRRLLALPRPKDRANPSLLIRPICIGRRLLGPTDAPVPAFRAHADAPLVGTPVCAICTMLVALSFFESFFSARFQLFTARPARQVRGRCRRRRKEG